MYGVSTEYVRIPYGSSTGYTDIVEKIKEIPPPKISINDIYFSSRMIFVREIYK